MKYHLNHKIKPSITKESLVWLLLVLLTGLVLWWAWRSSQKPMHLNSQPFYCMATVTVCK